jgi:hypothetical protein
MTQRHCDIVRSMTPTRSCVFPKMLVSGCSFTHNFPNNRVVNWPYFLRDLADIKDVYDVSLPGGGCQHIFNSVINEVERNPDIDPRDTLILVMWSGLSRTDIIAETATVEPWVRRVFKRRDDITDGVYRFDDRFSSLSIFNRGTMDTDPDPMAHMQQRYKRVIDTDAQILQSMLNIVTLAGYLETKGFTWMFMSWKDPQPDLDIVPGALSRRVAELMKTVLPLGDYARSQDQFDSTQHPSRAAHLGWTENHLIPALDQLGITHARLSTG